MTDVNLFLGGEGEGRQSPREVALDRALERLNIGWEGKFSTAFGPIGAHSFFWDRIGDIDYLNLQIVFSKNPKVCYQSLKRTIGKIHENFYNKDLLRLSSECVSDIFETVEKEGKIMRENGTMTEDTDKIASVEDIVRESVLRIAKAWGNKSRFAYRGFDDFNFNFFYEYNKEHRYYELRVIASCEEWYLGGEEQEIPSNFCYDDLWKISVNLVEKIVERRLQWDKEKAAGVGPNFYGGVYFPPKIASASASASAPEPTIQDTLAERGKRYGEFREHAKISQSLKRAMWAAQGWVDLPDDVKEALEMIQHKIARVLNGDHLYLDTARDIIGYMTLVFQRLEKTEGATDAETKIKIRTATDWKYKD